MFIKEKSDLSFILSNPTRFYPYLLLEGGDGRLSKLANLSNDSDDAIAKARLFSFLFFTVYISAASSTLLTLSSFFPSLSSLPLLVHSLSVLLN